ncbi:MAG: hypothetical protein M0R37_07785 [Bacteroidales bacterium]|nr:hypothetical protein [Bacteroidales bacterium]
MTHREHVAFAYWLCARGYFEDQRDIIRYFEDADEWISRHGWLLDQYEAAREVGEEVSTISDGHRPTMGAANARSLAVAGDGTASLDRSDTSSPTSFAVTGRAGGHGDTDAPSMCDPPNSSTADETGSLSPESEAVLENHHADTIEGMAA